MKKRIRLLFMILLILAVLLGAGKTGEKKTEVLMDASELYCDDSKFYGEAIIASENYKLAIIGFDGENIRIFDDICANWIDAIAEEGVVIYGNVNGEVGIMKLDSDYNVISNEIILTTDHLLIDPTIIKAEDTYYATVTEIVGTPNNSDINSENGLYTIRFYKSQDLSNWSVVSEIVSCKKNLEDVDVFYRKGIFHVIYEKEEVDGGDSAVYLQRSKDGEGKSWEEAVTLLESDCDHEPAVIERTWYGTYRLYYSCDKENVGQSYMGARMYYSEYDGRFKMLKKDVEIPSTAEEGILLYDVLRSNGTQKFLFCRNYYTDHALFIEER